MKCKSMFLILLSLCLLLTCAAPAAMAQTEEPVLHLSANGIETYDDGVMRASLTAVELTRLMGNGTNLGNTMEACDSGTGSVSEDLGCYETMWGQPVTTQEMISGMKAAGFDTLRIPVAWMTNATDLAKGDCTISEAYLDRVEEIINYALNADMYVIVNDHWDGGWYGMFGSLPPGNCRWRRAWPAAAAGSVPTPVG